MMKEESAIDLDFTVDNRESDHIENIDNNLQENLQENNEENIIEDNNENKEEGELEDGEISAEEEIPPEDKKEEILPPKPVHERIPSPHKNDDRESPRQTRRSVTRTLYIGDLPKTITEDRLYQIFKKYGDIIDIDIKYLRFGVATFAFIQFVDPISSMNAFENERFLIIDDCSIKVGFGRPNIYDTVFIGRYDSSDLPNILEKVQKFVGFEWSLTDKKIDQTIVKFESDEQATFVIDTIYSFDIPFQNVLVTYMCGQSIKKFISRMEKSGQNVDSRILREYGLEKHRREYSDSEDIYKNREKDRKRNSSHSDYRSEKSSDKQSSPVKHSKRYKSALHENVSNHHSENSSKGDSIDSLDRKGFHKENSQSITKIIIWNGELFLKRKSVNVSFLFLKGNRRVFDACLCNNTKGEEHIKSLKIEQRMSLDEEQFSLISDRIVNEEDCAFGVAVANQNFHQDEDLKKHFVDYFSDKNAAGVVNIHDTKRHSLTHVIYLFPVCSFTKKHSKDAGQEVREAMKKNPYLFIIAIRCQ